MPNPSAVPKMKPSGAIFAPQDELPIAKKDSPPAVLPRASPCLLPEKKSSGDPGGEVAAFWV